MARSYAVMLFWSALAVLVFVTLVALLRPLLARGPQVIGGSAREVFAAQLGELEADRDRGLISPADAVAARTEIARRLLRTRDEGTERPHSARPARMAAAAVAIFVPLAFLVGYLHLGAPQIGDQPLSARLAPLAPADLAAMVDKAEARLAANPDDGAGWAAIAPAYQQLQRFEEAAAAYARADAQLGPSVDRLIGRAESLTLANDGTVTPEARTVFEEALTLRPDAISPAIFLAIAARQTGDYDDARERWRELIARSTGTEPWLQVAAAEFQRMSPAPQAPTAPVGPTREAARAAAALPAQQQTAMVEAMVSRLAERLDGEGGSAAEWGRLVHSYRVLGRPQDAAAALERARAALPPAEFATIDQGSRP